MVRRSIAVIVPCHNESANILEALTIIERQLRQADQVHVIND
jgi:glycosyltransferase involved in cell wall biosynthesis